MRILISGAGIAGCTLANLLSRNGLRPTVVERSAGSRSSGAPVDVRGEAVDVADRLGITSRLRDAATSATVLSFVNGSGRRVGRIPLSNFAAGSRDIELPRGDLSDIIYEASRDQVEYLFDDTITGLAQDEAGVDVTFDRAPARRFDLVIGADGLHSTVRRLAFGPEQEFMRHLGVFVATLPLPLEVADPHEVVMYNTPGRALTIHPSRTKALAAFMFRAPLPSGFDHRDMQQHKRLLIEAFAGAGWRVPELLSLVRRADDLFFDSVSQVRVPQWSRGRVAVLGDAASCLSLFGDGSSSAMIGAATLAQALTSRGSDHEAAFADYETRHRQVVDHKQRNFSQGVWFLIPATRRGLALRNGALRLVPIAMAIGTAIQRLTRR